MCRVGTAHHLVKYWMVDADPLCLLRHVANKLRFGILYLSDNTQNHDADRLVNASLRMAVGVVVLFSMGVFYPADDAAMESGMLSGPLWLIRSPSSTDNGLGFLITALCVILALSACVRPNPVTIILAVMSAVLWLATGAYIGYGAAA